MSAFNGDNLLHCSKNMPWYKGFEVEVDGESITGMTLGDALSTTVKPPPHNDNLPFRLPVSGVYRIPGIGDVITGRVEQGTITNGCKVRFSPSGATGVIFSIEKWHRMLERAHCGDNVGFNVKRLDRRNMPTTNDVMSIDDVKEDPHPPRACTKFTAQIVVQEHPGKLRPALKAQVIVLIFT